MSGGSKIFLSTYEGKIDKQNRLLIPSNFRSVLENKRHPCVYGYTSFLNSCLEICTEERITKLNEFLETMEMFSPERDAISTAIFSDCEPMQLDAKGRILLSERLIKFACLYQKVFFVGKGKTFEIWNQDMFLEHYKKCRKIAQKPSLFKGS